MLTVSRKCRNLIAACAGLLTLAWVARAEFAVPTLDPATVPKYTTQLVIPPAMPAREINLSYDYYEIAMRQFQQQVLPQGMPQTTVWGYGSIANTNTFNFPAFTIEAKVNRPVRVKWVNQLVDKQNRFLPHLLPVDQTLHWANPNGLAPDSHSMDPRPYRGPVPMITHVHGAHVSEESDGFPEAWFLPDAKDIPAGYFTTGSKYEQFKKEFKEKYGVDWQKGSATLQYPNTQRASTLWYHDHSLGITRLNVYTGPAGFYLLRGGDSDLPAGVLPGPAPQRGDAPGIRYHEIPIAIQDRSFNADGSLFFPDSREFFDGIVSPYIGALPPGDISPIYNSEFFGNTIVVNGKTWPNLNVEPRRYRFRLLDGCNARTLYLKIVSGNPADPSVRSGPAALPFWQIGSEGGFLPAPVRQDNLLITLAERADVIVDFTGLAPGTKLYLINRGPEEPYNGQNLPPDDSEAPPDTTGQVMSFTIVPLQGPDTSTPPNNLRLPGFKDLGKPVNTHQVTLNEVEIIGRDAAGNFVDGPKQALLGILDKEGMTMPLMWSDPITEKPRLNQTEVWEIYNFTVDAHPIHLHQVQFQVLDRTPMGDRIGGKTTLPPNPWETGDKDTVAALPGYVTRLKARYDIPGLFVWHCHIIDHEDNEMMRPVQVVP